MKRSLYQILDEANTDRDRQICIGLSKQFVHKFDFGPHEDTIQRQLAAYMLDLVSRYASDTGEEQVDRSFLNKAPYPWTDHGAQEFHQYLIENYPTRDDIIQVLNNVGIPLNVVPLQNNPRSVCRS